MKRFDEDFVATLKVIVKDAVAEALANERTKSAMLTSTEVQKMFGVSRTTLWRWEHVDKKLVSHEGPGRKKMYRTEDVQALIK